jgi:hypothetical protein
MTWLPDYPQFFWLTAIMAVTLVGIDKAGFGGGLGVIATPLLALTIPVPEAAALLLPLLIITDLFSVYHYRHRFDRSSLILLLPAALVGIALGTLFFDYFSDNERVLKVGIGLIALLFVLFQATRALIFGVLEKYQPPAIVGVLLGGISGFTSTLAHVGGPPASMYLLPQKFPRDLFVGTTVILFTILNAVKLIPYSYLGLLRVGNLTTILVLSPLCYMGVRLGIYLNKRFSDFWFNWLIYALLFLTGLKLILG